MSCNTLPHQFSVWKVSENIDPKQWSLYNVRHLPSILIHSEKRGWEHKFRHNDNDDDDSKHK